MKNGIVAIVSNLISEKGKLSLLTGFDLDSNKKEATDAIQTVIAKYNYAPEFSEIRNQVGAVTSNII